jgi:hypothetical protein
MEFLCFDLGFVLLGYICRFRVFGFVGSLLFFPNIVVHGEGKNVDFVGSLILAIVDAYPYIAMDTEYPGIVLRPVGNFMSRMGSKFEYPFGHSASSFNSRVFRVLSR